MSTVTLPTKEYKRLQQQATAYRKLVGKLFATVVQDPVRDIVEDFHKTGLYEEAFLRDLEDGLRKSSRGK